MTTSQPPPTEYVRLCSKVPGASHVRDNIVCQDNFAAWPHGSSPSPNSVVVVADGHGSPIHSSSDIGSFLAAEIAIEVLAACANENSEEPISPRLYNFWKDKIPTLLCESWERRVLEHHEANPFQASDFYELSESEGSQLVAHPVMHYGTTLLSATVTKHALGLARIGDGLIVLVNDDGNCTLPFNEIDEEDERTYSLCSKNAATHFQVELLPIDKNPPAMVFLCSDGYYKDVGTIEAFLPLVTDLFQHACSHSRNEFGEVLAGTLKHRAQKASDDLTFAVLLRSDVCESAK